MNIVDSLQAMAASVARVPPLVLLHEVIGHLARDVGLPVEEVAVRVLEHLQLEGRAVEIYVSRAGVPQAVPLGTGTRKKLRDEVGQALRADGAGRGLAVRSLTDLPMERGLLLESLAEWWSSHRARARGRGVAEVAVSAADAVSAMGYRAASAPAPAPALAMTEELPRVEQESPKSPPLVVEADQLREGAPRFDASCVALYRERQRLSNGHKPMQRLVEKYGLSDGHLRKCIRHGKALASTEAPVPAVRSVFDLTTARDRMARRAA